MYCEKQSFLILAGRVVLLICGISEPWKVMLQRLSRSNSVNIAFCYGRFLRVIDSLLYRTGTRGL